MTTPENPLFVPSPAIVRPRFSLLSVAQIQEAPARAQWQGFGVTWEGAKCTPANITNGLICADEPEDPFNVPKDVDRGVPLYTGSPFVVYGDYNCGAIGRPLGEARERALANLYAGEDRAVERAIQLGEAGNAPSLVGSAVDLTPVGGGVSIVEAIATLEQYAAVNIVGVPTLHMTPYLATFSANEHLLEPSLGPSGWDLHTVAMGTPVAAGGGYVGVGPDTAESPGSPGGDFHWIYITGQVYVWRTEPWITPPVEGASVDRAMNNVTVLAERTYVVGWECVPAAIRVAL